MSSNLPVFCDFDENLQMRKIFKDVFENKSNATERRVRNECGACVLPAMAVRTMDAVLPALQPCVYRWCEEARGLHDGEHQQASSLTASDCI